MALSTTERGFSVLAYPVASRPRYSGHLYGVFRRLNADFQSLPTLSLRDPATLAFLGRALGGAPTEPLSWSRPGGRSYRTSFLVAPWGRSYRTSFLVAPWGTLLQNLFLGRALGGAPTEPLTWSRPGGRSYKTSYLVARRHCPRMGRRAPTGAGRPSERGIRPTPARSVKGHGSCRWFCWFGSTCRMPLPPRRCRRPRGSGRLSPW